jgi:hypothetical protein
MLIALVHFSLGLTMVGESGVDRAHKVIPISPMELTVSDEQSKDGTILLS